MTDEPIDSWAAQQIAAMLDRLLALLRRRALLPPEPWETTMPAAWWADDET